MKNFSAALLLTIIFSSPTFSQWIQQAFPTTQALWKVHFTNATTGWVLGSNHIFKTTDSGRTWSTHDTVLKGGGSALWGVNGSVAFFCEWASSNGPYRGIRKTTDGGLTWRTVDTTRFFYNNIRFATSQIGYAACGTVYPQASKSVIRKTTDGGESWQTITTLSTGGDFEAVSFVDAQLGWAIAYDGGVVYRTTNGGLSWTLQDSVGYYNAKPF